MRNNSLRRRLTVASAALAAGATLSACGPANETAANNSGGGSDLAGELNGAGSSAQQAAMQAWQAGFQTAHPDVTVNYDAIGSGGGREQFLAGGVAFAGSDDYLTEQEVTKATKVCHGAPIEIPVYVSPIAVAYNLPGVDELRLSPSTLAQIFAGKVEFWDAKAIAATNPGADLPHTAITPVHRSDESGTTGNFTDYLSEAAPSGWTYGSVETWPVKQGEAANGTSGVVAALKSGEGSIGYADASQAQDLAKAQIGVGSGYVGPTAEAAAAVLDESKPVAGRGGTDLAVDVNRSPSASDVYPIVLVSYQIFCPTYDSEQTAKLVKAFESSVVSQAGQQAAAQQAGSAPITDTIRTKARTAIESVSAR
ncbi:MAG: phosphate ABC transporter substrate-binding protein PstS [Nocardioidaceae bacterium]